MSFGFGRLRLSPAAFWALTPRELVRAMASRETARAGLPARAELDRLMQAFPDGAQERKTDG